MPEQKNPNLTQQQKDVLFKGATEAPFSGKLLQNKESGAYLCANCGAELFISNTKFDSRSGWPSFYDSASTKSITLLPDSSHGMERTEVVCASCGSHLGHMFEDAFDQPTGQRYCINSLSLDFKPENKDNS